MVSTKHMKQHNCFNIDNDKKNIWAAANHPIIMISEQSQDSEDRSNDAENSASSSQE